MTVAVFDEPAADAVPDCSAFVATEAESGVRRLLLLVSGIECASCIQAIERALKAQPGVVEARVNFTTRRLLIRWRGGVERGDELAALVARRGFGVTPFDPAASQDEGDGQERELLRALGVAGFASGNIMTLSVAVWGGLAEMGEAMRGLHYWFSALIALPAIVYAGRPFYRSAWNAVRQGHVNMDVPISLGVLLATAMSLFETVRGGEHAYFDAAVCLLFFLLAGRYLDLRARGRARAAAAHLLSLGVRSAKVVRDDGRVVETPVSELAPGMTLLVGAGEKIAADGLVSEGASDIDMSALSGESRPVPVEPGTRIFAGTVNATAPLKVRITAVGEATVLAEIVRLMETAEQGRARYVVLADRAARFYAPVVHGLALLTFIGWMLAAGEWQPALLNAVAVLIVTCPCALGLAVPAVQVVASGRLFRRGVLLKSATALERIAEIDTVVFDKTGTLTLGRPQLVDADAIDRQALRLAAGIAKASRHPLSRALSLADPDAPLPGEVREQPGCGLEAVVDGVTVRLGSRLWCGVLAEAGPEDAGSEIWLTRPGHEPVRFTFQDRLRPEAAKVIAKLREAGCRIVLLSGDRHEVVSRLAREVDIDDWQAGCLPADKVRRLNSLAAAGSKVLMVGDGLNDAPALAAAYASMSPASAADISQVAADAVFQGETLMPVAETLKVARAARRLVRQNFALSILYNVVTVPLAVAGFVTPLVAAIAMSASSVMVVGNALRLQWGARR
jgi:Cu2+-exporting ATPase